MITYFEFADLANDTFFIYKGEQYQKLDDPTGSGLEFNCINVKTQKYVQLADGAIVGVEKKINI